MKKCSLMRAMPVALLVACLAFVLLLVACSSSEPANTEEETPEEPTFAVQIFIDCEKNLMFSRYDVDVSVDGEEVGDVEHGGEATFEVKLTKGQHELELEEKGSNGPDGKTTFVVEGGGDEFSYHIKCTKDQIEIESIKEESGGQTIDTQVVSYGGISIEVPGTWTVADAEDGKYVYPDYGGLVYLRAIDLGLGQSSADEAYAEYIGGLQAGGEYTVIGEVEKSKVGGADAFRNEIELQTDDMHLTGAIELIFTESKTYSVMFTIPDSDHYQHLDDITVVLDSTRLDESVASASADDSEGEVETVTGDDDNAAPQDVESSKYEYAYVRRMSSYDLYFLIDLDEMTATSFGTNDSGSMVLPCTGNLESGLTVDYGDEGFVEHLQFKKSGDDSVVVLIDANGFDWEYTKVDVAEAEAVLISVS